MGYSKLQKQGPFEQFLLIRKTKNIIYYTNNLMHLCNEIVI